MTVADEPGPAEVARNPSHAQAMVFVDELSRLGVEHAVLAPGSRSTALAIALHDDPRLRLHVEIDERSAGFLALGIGRATGRPAAVVVTSGSATANLHPAVIEADLGRVPLLLLTADRPPELRHTGANQTIDQVKLYGDAVRWFVDLGVAEDRASSNALWRSTVCRAVHTATGVVSGAPGPVHLNLPFREPTVPATDDGRSRAPGPFVSPTGGRAGGAPWTDATRQPRPAPAIALDRLAEQIAATPRGLLVVGDVSRPVAGLADMAERAGWPIIAEPHSSARAGSTALQHAHYLVGHTGFAAAHRPDLVVRIGRVGLSRPLGALLDAQVPQVLIDPDGAWLDPDRTIADVVVADPSSVCGAVAERLAAPATSDWLDGWLAADATVHDALEDVLSRGGLSEPLVARTTAAAVPSGGTLVAASSMPIRDLDQHMAPRADLRVVANRGASGIDGFVSLVLGVAATNGNTPTVALAGDLSFLHDRNGFLLRPDAARLDATFVVVDNDGGGIFHFLPQADFPASFERVFGTPHGRDLAAVAAADGLAYRLVETTDQLADAIATSTDVGGLHLLHVRTDRTANRDLHADLTAAAHRALDAR